jgi:hypothetical protein
MSVEGINYETGSSNENSELLNQKSDSKYRKNFGELEPRQKVLIINQMPKGAYLRTSDKKELLQLAERTGPMDKTLSREYWEKNPTSLLASYKEGLYFDGKIIILDQDVSAKLLQEQMIEDINTRRKDFQAANSDLQGQEWACEELWDEINKHHHDLSFLPRFIKNEGSKIIKESTVEMEEIAFVSNNAIVLANHGRTIFKMIDARYYAGLTKEWQDSTFYTRYEDYEEVEPLVLKAENEIKAIILPRKDTAPTKLIEEVQSEV